MTSSYDYSPPYCKDTVTLLLDQISSSLENITSPRDLLNNLTYICPKGCQSVVDDEFGKPLVWIGLYIGVASFVCILAMVVDLFLGFSKERCYQIPCRYFSLVNVASMTVVTIAMKLTVDMTGSMPGNLDQATKLGSMAFMCIMMAILNPSFASMDNKTLVANILGLAILVITIIVNILIEINTRVIKHKKFSQLITFRGGIYSQTPLPLGSFSFASVAYIYIGMMIFLLLISISTAIIIPSFKKILDFKYQLRRKALNNSSLVVQRLQQLARVTSVEELKKYVTSYWIMAKSGSPHIVMACSVLSYASFTICLASTLIYLQVFFMLVSEKPLYKNYASQYRRSTQFIFITQVTGIIIGFVIVTLRCFKSMNFNLDATDNMIIFGERKYWTKTLDEWNESPIAFLSRNHRSRNFVHNMKTFILSLCILLQNAFLELNRVIGLPSALAIAAAFNVCTASGESRSDDNIGSYHRDVLKLNDEVQISERVVKGLSESMNRLITQARVLQSSNIIDLLVKSRGFEGVENFDHNDVPNLPSVNFANSWSLPVVTLACIARFVPTIRSEEVDTLLESVDEALWYTNHVDQSVNTANEYACIHDIPMKLWYEVKHKFKWLGDTIEGVYVGKTSREILGLLAEKAEGICRTDREQNYPYDLIAANSMYRITRTILLRDERNFSDVEMFDLLSGMIADILFACFTNIPRVIRMKCDESVIEKREASVEAATKLLGRSENIINSLQERELPVMDPDKRASIDEWRLYLLQSVP